MNNELKMIWKEAVLPLATIGAFIWKGLRKIMKMPIEVVCVPAEIQIKHLQNTSQKC
jgi:hypothetical protein